MFSLNSLNSVTKIKNQKGGLQDRNPGSPVQETKMIPLYYRDTSNRVDPYNGPYSCVSDFSDFLNSLNSLNSMRVRENANVKFYVTKIKISQMKNRKTNLDNISVNRIKAINLVTEITE